MIVPGEPGVYVVNSGSTGVAETFFALGIIYFVVMIIAAFSYRIPREGWLPQGWVPPTTEKAQSKMITQNDVHIDPGAKNSTILFDLDSTLF